MDADILVSVSFLQDFFKEPVDTLIVAGSGLSDPLKSLFTSADYQSIDYEHIPHFPKSTVPGHAGRLLIGQHEHCHIAVMLGRFHYYEGHSMESIGFPFRVMARLGIRRLILTNACGAIAKDLAVGDVILIKDHVAFPCLAGASPLRGAEHKFLSVTHLWKQFPGIIKEMGLRPGVYGFVSGPQYETPAEIKALRLLGIDGVGMSTVPEAIVAKQEGMLVAGLSLVTNICFDGEELDEFGIAHEPSHAEVLANSVMASARLVQAVKKILESDWGHHQ